jgi:hypothetical protein
LIHTAVFCKLQTATVCKSVFEVHLCESLSDWDWLYRGVPKDSYEASTAEMDGEVIPPMPGLVGDHVRYAHIHGEQTESGYTSWTTNPETAEYFAKRAAESVNKRARHRYRYSTGDEEPISYETVILRVPTKSLDESRLFEGRCEEGEWLIEGLVEQVEIWNGDEDEN